MFQNLQKFVFFKNLAVKFIIQHLFIFQSYRVSKCFRLRLFQKYLGQRNYVLIGSGTLQQDCIFQISILDFLGHSMEFDPISRSSFNGRLQLVFRSLISFFEGAS